MEDRSEKLRAFFAKLICTAAKLGDPRIEQAFRAVQREPFAGPGPWLLTLGGHDYVKTPDDDPAFLYQNLLLALDAEPNAIGGTVTVAQTAEAAGRLNMATASLPLIYINRYGPDRRGTGLPNNVLSRCPLWLPAYSSRPVCPPGWSKWVLWQHTDGNIGSDAVPVAGIGRCDRSRFAGAIADLVTWWKNPQP